MKEFLDELKKNYDDKRVMIIGHRATQYGLEHWINRIPLKVLVTTPFKWQPGWTYKLEQLLLPVFDNELFSVKRNRDILFLSPA